MALKQKTEPTHSISIGQAVYYCLLSLASIASQFLAVDFTISNLTGPSTEQCVNNSYTPASNHLLGIIDIGLIIAILLLLAGLFRYKSWLYKISVLLIIVAI